jgi:hypothetical protein
VRRYYLQIWIVLKEAIYLILQVCRWGFPGRHIVQNHIENLCLHE